MPRRAVALLITSAAAFCFTGCASAPPAVAATVPPLPPAPPAIIARTAYAAPPAPPVTHLVRWRCDWADFGQFTAVECRTNLAAGPWVELARFECDGREVYEFADLMDAPAKFYRFKTWLEW